MDENLRDQITARMKEIDGLAGLAPCSPEFNSWRKSTEELILRNFGNGRELESFNAIFYTPLFLSCRMSDAAFTEAYRKGLEEARVLLAGL
jgi:hypothetical protein